MGTSWAIKLIQEPESAVIEHQRIQGRLDEIEQAMSNWVEDSDVSRFNRMTQGCLLVSEHTERVASMANIVSEKSHGYFDATLSPLIELWGFGVVEEPPEEPSADLFNQIMSETGFSNVLTTERQLCKQRDQIAVNYSAIAKGYAVDQLAELIIEAGYSSFLVEVGGELYGQGTKPKGDNWKVGIEKPGYGFTQELYSTLELNGVAIATSGDYRNYYEIDSVRYSHIINPKTGRPVSHRAASVTVISESAMVADAWATALLAAGPVEGMQMAEEHQLVVLMILHADTKDQVNEQGFEQLISSSWPAQ